jgi:hypothetical protein
MQGFDKEQAKIDSLQADSVAKLLSALGDVENAAINIGSVLLMKVDGQIIVRNLSQEEMILIKRKSADLVSPRSLLQALEEFACADGRDSVRSGMAITATSDDSSGGSQLNSA